MDVERLVKSCVAIGALTTLEMTALIMQIDGALFLPVAAAIAGLAGFELGRKKG